MDTVASISDLRDLARKRLPRPIYDFIDGGAFAETTRRANCDDFAKWHFKQRVGIDISQRSLATTFVGENTSMPMAISPTGMSGVLNGGRDGEILAARAADAAGIPYCLGMVSVASIEELHKVVDRFWFQICLLNDRELMQAMLARAHNAGCPVLVLTLTWPVTSQLRRMMRRRDSVLPPRFTPKTILTYAVKPEWSLRTLMAGRIRLGNFEPHRPGKAGLYDIPSYLNPSGTWDDVKWVRDIWPGKLIVKGVLAPEDAEAAVAAGVDAISVSNHGGNQLDETLSTIAALPEVVAAVAGRAEVFIDGGIRSGQDVLKALALGARGCLLGRAHLYGLAAAGETGVSKALDILRAELDTTMALCGLTDVRHASRSLLF